MGKSMVKYDPKLLLMANAAKVAGHRVYPIHGKTWEDCYCHDSGFHVLVYHLTETEKTAHEIAMDDNYNIVKEM